MTTLNISLPQNLKRFLDDQAAKAGCVSTEQYVEKLIREEQRRHAKAALEAELIKGMESGPSVEMTAAEWASIRREVQERIGRRENAK